MLDARVHAELEAGRYRFIDAGCGSGGSLDHCERRFQRRPGLGLDWYGADLEVAREHGFAVAHCDLKTVTLPERSVDFVSMMDFLEHLPDVAATKHALERFGRAARDFLFIRHPSFEDIDYLASLGLKLAWTDWEAHPNMMRLEDYRRIFDALGWTDYVIIPDLSIRDSTHGAVLPADAPRDTEAYEEGMHGPKARVTFDRPVFGKFDIFVRLNRDMPEQAWREVATIAGWRGVWLPPGAKKITDALHDRATQGRRIPPPTEGDVHALTDALLWRVVIHDAAPGAGQRKELADHVRACAASSPHGVLHFVHLLDALNQTSDVRRILAVGREAIRPAAFLAARCSSIQVDAEPTGSGGDYDFVFTIAAGEPRHIRWRDLIDRVRPGGWLYVGATIPGADADADHDTTLRQLPYASFSTANIARPEIARGLGGLATVLNPPVTGETLTELVRLAMLDLTPARGDSWRRPEGIRYLIRKRAAQGMARTA